MRSSKKMMSVQKLCMATGVKMVKGGAYQYLYKGSEVIDRNDLAAWMSSNKLDMSKVFDLEKIEPVESGCYDLDWELKAREYIEEVCSTVREHRHSIWNGRYDSVNDTVIFNADYYDDHDESYMSVLSTLLWIRPKGGRLEICVKLK